MRDAQRQGERDEEEEWVSGAQLANFALTNPIQQQMSFFCDSEGIYAGS